MVVLDSIIRSLSLTSLDADHHPSSFSPRQVPTVTPDEGHRSRSWSIDSAYNRDKNSVITNAVSNTRYTPPGSSTHEGSVRPASGVGCSCMSLALGASWAGTMEHTPLWASTPAWSSVNEGEIRKESCRRLCWSAMILSAGHLSYSMAHSMSRPDLFVAHPANVRRFPSHFVLCRLNESCLSVCSLIYRRVDCNTGCSWVEGHHLGTL
jgi:hypothetical protein